MYLSCLCCCLALFMLCPRTEHAVRAVPLQLFFDHLGSILALGVLGTALAALLLAAFLTAGFSGLHMLRLQVG